MTRNAQTLHRLWIVTAVSFSLFAFFFAAYALQVEKWVGRTDLDIELLVVDCETGQPIPKATIDVVADPLGGTSDDSRRQRFQLISDDSGRALRTCPSTTCIGSYGAWGLINTFVVYLPEWTIRVSADGYQSSQPIALNNQTRRESVQRLPDRQSKLLVEVPLQRTGVRR